MIMTEIFFGNDLNKSKHNLNYKQKRKLTSMFGTQFHITNRRRVKCGKTTSEKSDIIFSEQDVI